MTIEHAAEILDREKHGGADFWSFHEPTRNAIGYDADGSPFLHLSTFEAIAIAEAYEKAARNRADAVLKRPLD